METQPIRALPVLAVELSLVPTSGGSEPPVTPGPVLHTQHEHTHASPPIKKREKLKPKKTFLSLPLFYSLKKINKHT